MNYDEWFEANADDLALHGAKATSRLVWNAAVAAERERCADIAKARADKIAAEAERDCRTCAHYLPHHRAGVMHCTSALRCVGGDRHCKAGSVQQWEAAPLRPAPF